MSDPTKVDLERCRAVSALKAAIAAEEKAWYVAQEAWFEQAYRKCSATQMPRWRRKSWRRRAAEATGASEASAVRRRAQGEVTKYEKTT